jgi:hypothetical protein
MLREHRQKQDTQPHADISPAPIVPSTQDYRCNHSFPEQEMKLITDSVWTVI